MNKKRKNSLKTFISFLYICSLLLISGIFLYFSLHVLNLDTIQFTEVASLSIIIVGIVLMSLGFLIINVFNYFWKLIFAIIDWVTDIDKEDMSLIRYLDEVILK